MKCLEQITGLVACILKKWEGVCKKHSITVGQENPKNGWLYLNPIFKLWTVTKLND